MPFITKLEAEKKIAEYASKQGITHRQTQLIYLRKDINIRYYQTFFRVNPQLFNDNRYSVISTYLLNVLFSKQFYIDYVSQNIFLKDIKNNY